MFVEGFCHFFSDLHFSIKHYTNFLNLTKFVSQHLIATHGNFHRHQFLTANYFFIRPVLSYLAVATATWQHWPDRSLKSSSASLSDRRSSSRWSWFSQQQLPWPFVGVFFWLVGVETNFFREGFSKKLSPSFLHNLLGELENLSFRECFALSTFFAED